MRIERHSAGARLIQGGAILSEILARPGPTHSIFDVLAAAVTLHEAAAPRVAMLGFAGGGMIAPLRALGSAATIEACDLDATGFELFEELSSEWRGDVQFEIADATDWIRNGRSKFEVVIEDLSCLGDDGEETKPVVSVTNLPRAIQRRIRKDGLVVTNLLPVPGVSWRSLIRQVAEPWERGVVVEFDEWENRILLTGTAIGSASDIGHELGLRLESMGSELARRFLTRNFSTT
ncbi:MAG: hypothetical protein H6832_17680 [Planctomycetes bacterium]|nr:hypothetical protein [Planctomycetota bacterium]